MARNVVSFHYTLRDDAGEVLDSSARDKPIVFLEGSGMIIDGLEAALRALSTGETQKISIAPEQAYGAYDERQIQTVDRAALPVEGLEIGAMFQVGDDHGAPVVRVVEIDGDKVKLDANHPLAGQRLHFEVEVLERREATPEEINHGHVHGPGGHHH